MNATTWPRSPAALIAEQEHLAAAACASWRPGRDPLAIGACVVLFPRAQTGAGSRGDRAWAAAAVVLDGTVIAVSQVTGAAGAPYAPGLLALREGPCLEAAVRALAAPLDVLLVDATGRDHPRRAGLALQLGAVLDLPTVGVTHRPLLAYGDWPEDVSGAVSPLEVEGERVGSWLRTRRGARPLAVHAAWRTDVDTAVHVVTSATHVHRTPEPFRQARMLARSARAQGQRPG